MTFDFWRLWSHALSAEIAIAILFSCCCVDLWVGVEVANSLDVDDDQLVAGSLKGEVGESLGRHPLRSVTVVDETGVGIVLDVFSVDVMLNVEEWRLWSVDQFNDSH